MEQKTSGGKLVLLGLQHMFAMFGATVLMPLLTGLSPGVALFCAGLGTLLFFLITKRKVPVFLGSSFSFIAAIILATATCASGELANTFKEGFAASGYNAIGYMLGEGGGITKEAAYQAALPYATGAIITAGALYLVLALLVKIFGADKIKKALDTVRAVLLVIRSLHLHGRNDVRYGIDYITVVAQNTRGSNGVVRRIRALAV